MTQIELIQEIKTLREVLRDGSLITVAEHYELMFMLQDYERQLVDVILGKEE